MMIPAKQPPGIPCQDQVNIVAVAGPVEVVDSFQAGRRAVVDPVGVQVLQSISYQPSVASWVSCDS